MQIMSRIPDPLIVEHVRASFARQNAMTLIKASMRLIEHGHTEIHLPHWSGVEQQHGFVHGGVIGMIAAFWLVLTVEYKMTLLAPADGEQLIARGRVVRAGRTLIVTQAEVFAVKDGRETLCALMQQTIMVMHDKVEK